MIVRRCGSDATIGIRSSSKTWYDLLIIDGRHSIRMTFVEMSFFFRMIFISLWFCFQREKSWCHYQWYVRISIEFSTRILVEHFFFSLCYTSVVWLSTEVDGIRIITTRTLDFFERLPNELFNIFDLLSTSPGSKLYNAYMNYKYENQTAEMLLKQLKSAQSADGLEVAVKQCIAAASHEHDPAIQKILLKVNISSLRTSHSIPFDLF